MDNKTPEINRTQESQIPENWQFSERKDSYNWPVTEIIQVDPENGFLALKQPFGNRTKDIEYFFNHQGGVYQSSLKRENLAPKPRIEIWIEDKEFGSRFKNWGSAGISVALFKSELVPLHRSSGKVEETPVFDHFAKVSFDAGKLVQVELTNLFAADGDRRIISPLIEISPDEKGNFSVELKNPQKWKIFKDRGAPLGEFDTYARDEEGRYKQDFKVKYSVTDGRLTVSQTHIATGITKTIEVPMTLDMRGVRDAFSSKAPYQEVQTADGKSHLGVPWRNIDKLVGAKLSFSPPPKPTST